MKTKWNLNGSEQRAHSANVERLRSAGIAIGGVYDTVSSEPPLLRIDQSGDSVIYAGNLGGMALAICVRLTVLKSGIFPGCEITIPGCDANIFLVELPEGSLSYKGLHWLDLERGVVLNHRILGGRPLSRNENLDGLLVAQSFDRLPSQFQSGMPISARICLADQSENFFTSEVQLRLERYAQRGKPPKKRDRLFASEQVIVTRERRQGQEVSAGRPKADGWGRDAAERRAGGLADPNGRP